MDGNSWPTFDSALGIATMVASLVAVACGLDLVPAFIWALIGFAIVGYDLGRALSERGGDR